LRASIGGAKSEDAAAHDVHSQGMFRIHQPEWKKVLLLFIICRLGNGYYKYPIRTHAYGNANCMRNNNTLRIK
jgi:hypothetical protein